MSLKNREQRGDKLVRVTGVGFMLLIALVLVPTVSWAQKIEITPMVGWELTGKVGGDIADIDFKDSVNYAVIFGYQFIPNTFAEFSYTRIDTKATVKPPIPPKYIEDLKIAINYFLIGVTQQFLDGRVHPFVNGSLGAAWFDPKEGGYKSEWFFAAALGGGAKIDITKTIGIRLQGRLLMPMTFSGGGLWFGTGGIGAGIYTDVLWQGDFSAGVVIGLGEDPGAQTSR